MTWSAISPTNATCRRTSGSSGCSPRARWPTASPPSVWAVASAVSAVLRRGSRATTRSSSWITYRSFTAGTPSDWRRSPPRPLQPVRQPEGHRRVRLRCAIHVRSGPPQRHRFHLRRLHAGSTSQAARVIAMADAMLRRSSYFAYIQDDWKITPKLTLNVGVRYENARPWHDKYRGIMNIQLFDLGVGPNGLFSGHEGPHPHPAGKRRFLSRPQFPLRRRSGSPRPATSTWAAAWSIPTTTTSRRVSASPTARRTAGRSGPASACSIVQDIGNPIFDMARNLAGRDLFVTSIETRNARHERPVGVRAASAFLHRVVRHLPGGAPVSGQRAGQPYAYVFQWLFNIQREITQNIVLEVGYQGNEGHKLPVRVLQPAHPEERSDRHPDGRAAAALAPLRPHEGTDGERQLELSCAQREADAAVPQGLTYLVGFTWSKAIDNGSAVRTNSGDNLWPVNSYDFRRSAACRNSTSAAGSSPPMCTNCRSERASRWRIMGVIGQDRRRLAVGRHRHLCRRRADERRQIGDTAALNTNGNRPDATGISPNPANQTPQQFWNVASFNVTSPDLNCRPGNMGRNTLIRPATRQADLSLARNMRIRENHSLNFRFEAFNSTNHPNWNTPSTDPRSAATFGVITSARTMRQLQFALKYAF